MLSFTWRYTALATMVSAVSGYALVGELPTQTLMPFQTIGIGYPIKEALQTEAPSLELVKKHLAKRAVTNTCSEWSISGGLGYTPICDFSETCLFTSATDGYLYEGCGQTSIAYNWITACYDYNEQTGLPPVSNTYCPSSAPYCGSFIFVYDAENTFYNFGCSITSYGSTAFLVANSTTDLAAGGTSKITAAPTVTVTKAPDTSTTAPPQGLNTPATSTADGNTGNTDLPTINPTKKKKKTPIGAIVGGVVGGVVVIAAIAAIVWFCLRKRRQDKLKNETPVSSNQAEAEAATAAAFHNHTANQNRISEMGGDPKAPTVFPPGAGYTQQHQQNQQGAFVATNEKTHQEYYQPPAAGYNNELADTHGSQSPPPPLYANANLNPNPQNQNNPNASPSPNSPPLSTYTELDSTTHNTGRASVPPVSPVGTYTTNRVQSPSISELGSTNRASELGSGQREFNAYNPPMPEMSATAPQVQRQVQNSGVDMSGAPINESFNPHEMP